MIMSTTRQPMNNQDLLGASDMGKYQEHVLSNTPEPNPAPYDSDEENLKAKPVENDSKFSPNRIFYIQQHTMWSNEIVIVEITTTVPIVYQSGDISDDLHNAAK